MEVKLYICLGPYVCVCNLYIMGQGITCLDYYQI